MVQEVDAAKKRVQARADAERRRKAELEERTIRFSWHVVEHTPGYNTGGYYDTDVPAKNVKVSPDFDSEEEAVAWMERHVPDKGKSLHVKRMRLLRRVYQEWVGF